MNAKEVSDLIRSRNVLSMNLIISSKTRSADYCAFFVTIDENLPKPLKFIVY
ncbi:hypothetical protein KUL10_24870 [Glaciecola sp. KUL10]|nr:hypothetical protein KUL10_24870 [Glaciecola sp. KUL10]